MAIIEILKFTSVLLVFAALSGIIYQGKIKGGKKRVRQFF